MTGSVISAETPIVLVVDDDRSVRDSLRRLIASVGMTMEAFPTAQAFLSTPRRDAPDCLVLDVRLPGLSGFDLQRELVKTDATRPIIFLTGHGDIPMPVRAMKAGAIEFLTKPFRGQDLLDAIRSAIDRESHRSSGAARAGRASSPVRHPDAARTGRDGRGSRRSTQQAHVRRVRDDRSHGQGTARAGHAEDASRVSGRARPARRPRRDYPCPEWSNPTKVG